MAANERLSNLMFLLGLAPLAAGCSGDDGGGDTGLTTASTMTTMTTMSGTTATGDGSGDAGSAPTDASAEDGPEPTTSPMDGTDGPGATDDGPGTTDDGGTGEPDCSDPEMPMNPPSAACQAYTDLLNECDYRGTLSMECIDYYNAYCQYESEAFGMVSPACATAYEDFLTCLSALTCEELETETACGTEGMTFETECMLMGGTAPPRTLKRRG